MGFNTKYLFPSDDRREIVNKINYNFYQLFFNSVGGNGPVGIPGPTGLIGQVGFPGNNGEQGERAVNWYFNPVPPVGESLITGDLWVNIGLTGGRLISVYDGLIWVSTNETLLSDSIFNQITAIQGPGAAQDHNAVSIAYSTPQTPQNFSVVLTDSEQSVANANPNLSKLLIATDSSEFIKPLFSFGKTFLQSPQIPGYIWKDLGNDYNFEFVSPNNLTYSIGSTGEFSSTGGTAFINSAQTTTVTGNAVSVIGATGVSGAFSFNTASSLVFSSNRTQISPTSFSLFGFSGNSITSNIGLNSINLQSTQGINIGIQVSDSQLIGGFTNNLASTDQYYYLTKGNGTNVIGNIGLTGSAGVLVNLVKPFNTLVYNVGPTFSNPPFTNSFAEAAISNLYEDVVRVSVKNLDLSIVSADGRSNRFYLQFSNFTQLLVSVGQVRTFDFLLDDLLFGFGGIRVIGPLINTVIPISDTGLGNTQACRHIRITFMPSRNGFYYNAYSTSNNLCGFAQYALTEEVEEVAEIPVELF